MHTSGNQIYKNMIIRGTRHLINYHGAFLQKTEYFNLHDNYEVGFQEYHVSSKDVCVRVLEFLLMIGVRFYNRCASL